MYLSTADGGASITDAAIEANALIQAGHILAGSKAPPPAKNGARFNFEFPGSLQGFPANRRAGSSHDIRSPTSKGTAGTDIAASPSAYAVWRRRWRVRHADVLRQGRLHDADLSTAGLSDAHSGQHVECRVEADPGLKDVAVRLFASVYNEHDELGRIYDERQRLGSGGEPMLSWRVPDTGGYPIFEIGLEFETQDASGIDGRVYVDYLSWSGAPEVRLCRPDNNLSTMWKHAWVNNVSQFQTRWEGLRVTNGEGIGFISQGSRDWRDYRVRSEVTPLLAKAWGLAARVQGRKRYYALMFDAVDGGRVKLVKRDHDENILAKDNLAWELDRPYALELRLRDTEIQAFIDGKEVFAVRDEDRLPLRGGAVGLVVDTDQSPAKPSMFLQSDELLC